MVKRACVKLQCRGGIEVANPMLVRHGMPQLPVKHVIHRRRPLHHHRWRFYRFVIASMFDPIRHQRSSHRYADAQPHTAMREVHSTSAYGALRCSPNWQCVGASPAHVIAAIFIFYQMMSPETPKNGAHDSTGATTGVCHGVKCIGIFSIFFRLFCRHTASAPITAGTHTGGVQ